MNTLPHVWQFDSDASQPSAGTSLWDELRAALDIQQYKPVQGTGILSKEMNDKSGRHFILKNAQTHSYMRLSPEEFWIWGKIDGEKTVQQLVLAYFMQYKAFAFAPIVSLIERLRDSHMLAEEPRHLYAEVSASIQEQSFVQKLTWIGRTVFTKEFVIKNLDKHMETIHRYGGWILFTIPAQVMFFLLSIIGVPLFIILARDPQYNLLNLQTALQLGLVAYIPLIIHEFGHAITAKHVGCEVYKGGAMLYYGMPAAFIDTTDVWMFGKRARLAVTWAGPYTGYILGGACALYVYFTKDIAHGTAVFLLQVALTGIFTTTMNILPLLKLDGYYLLSDALEIPRLRERSMEFITRNLGGKIAKREKWTREEAVFLIFGILAFLSTIYFTWAGISFWDHQATTSISELLNLQGDFGGMLINVGLAVLAVSTIIYSLVFAAGSARQGLQWIQQKGWLSTRWRAGIVILISAVMLTYAPRIILPTLSAWFITAGGLAALVFGAWFSFAIFRGMRGSIHAWMWFFAAIGLLIGAGGFLGGLSAEMAKAGDTLYAAGVLILLGLYIFSGRLMTGLRGSWRAVSLVLMAMGTMVWIASYVMPLEIRTLAGLILLGGILHWGLRPATPIQATEKTTTGSTREKMARALQEIRATILSELALDFGKRTSADVEKGVYKAAKKKIGDGQFSSTMTGMTPTDYGAVMALALEELLSSVERAAGTKYARRALAYGYDKLNWELQETLEDHILKYVSYADRLSVALSATRDDRDSLLRSVPIFVTLTEAEFAALGKRFKSKLYTNGEDIIRAGEAGDKFYVLRAGKVSVLSAGGERVNTLKRGDYFGEGALLTNQKRSVTIRAVTPVEVLFLNKTDFDQLIRDNVTFDEKARDEFHLLGVLRQIPLFEQFESWELRLLAGKLQKAVYDAGGTIFHQGEAGDSFYIIESGSVGVQIDADQRAKLGTGEYFGEIALLMNTPRTATVIALQPVKLFQLKAVDFNELIRDSAAMKQALERASSRRLLANEYWARSGVNA